MIVSEYKLREIVRKLKKQNKTIVFTNGCFDILHIGHIRLFKKAKLFGDYLIVAINSDSSVRRLKGKNRPIVTEKYRAEILDSIRYIDLVCIFNELTPEKIIKELKPDVLVKGSDWKLHEIVGREYVKKVVRIPLVGNFSTSNLIKQILITR